MATYKHTAKAVKYWGNWCIKRKIKREVKFLGFRFWRTVETKYFGPYDGFVEAQSAIGESFEFYM